jgi:predicted RNA-binding protein Jag
MSPAERRVLHEALGEVPEVWAQSDGEGVMRRLWVMPRKA